MKAFLILEDGHVFTGTAIGADKEIISQIVFNTSMTGYLEVLTDPSYAGQAVVMTYPLIGNYGICYEDMESKRPWPDGYIVRELSRMPSNFRSQGTIQEFLEKNEIPGICGIDTRALTQLLREKGTMNGMITRREDFDLEEILPKLKAYSPTGVVMATTCKEREVLPGDGYKVALLDLGAKKNIGDSLHKRGCEVTIYPADTKAEDILAANPDGIMLSNGLVALSGAFLAQYQGFADVKMGQGAIVIGLAAMIIGEALFSKIFKNFALRLLSVAFGSIIYYIVIQAVITVGFDANLLKLLSAVIVAIFLAIPYWKRKYAQRYVKKPKGEQKNA